MIPQVDPGAILPLIGLAAGVLGVVAVDVLLLRRRSFLGRPLTEAWRGSLFALLAVCVLAGVFVLAVQGFDTGGARVFDPGLSSHDRRGLVLFDRLANLGTGLAVAAAGLLVLASVEHVRELRLPPGPFHALLLLSTLGCAAAVCAADLLSLFLALELASLPLHALSALATGRGATRDGGERGGAEAALKHFLLGGFATALLLFGSSLLFGATGETSFVGIRRGLEPADPLAMAGVSLVLASLAFRIGAFPFHQWVPDVHEGSPLPATALLAVAVRASAAIALLRFLVVGLGALHESLEPVLFAGAAASLLVGFAMAFVQRDLKRLLAYLIVGQTGFVLLGLSTGSRAGHAAALDQLLSFVFVGMGAYAVLLSLSAGRSEHTHFEDLRGLGLRRPALAAAFTLFAAGLAAVPGTLGFVARLEILSVALDSGRTAAVALCAGASGLGFVTCLRIPLHLYGPANEGAEAAPPRRAAAGEWLVICVCAAAVLGLGLVPDGLGADAPDFLPEPLRYGRDAVAALARGVR